MAWRAQRATQPGSRLFDPPKVGLVSPSGRTGETVAGQAGDLDAGQWIEECNVPLRSRAAGSGLSARTGQVISFSPGRSRPEPHAISCSPARRPGMALYPVSAMASVTPARPNRWLRPCARQKFGVPVRSEQRLMRRIIGK